MKRPFQFSLRTLLILISATAVVFGIIAWMAPESRLRLAGWTFGIVICLAMLEQLLQIVLFPVVLIAIFFERCREMIAAMQGKNPPHDD